MNRIVRPRNLLAALVVANLAFAGVMLSGCETATKDTEAATKDTEADQNQPAPAAAKVVAPAPSAKTQTVEAAAAETGDEHASCAGKDRMKANNLPAEESDSEYSCASAGEDKEPGGCNRWDEAAAEVIERDVPKDAIWTTLKVTGMTCGGCERRVIANLGKIDGVYSVEADAELGQVRVAMDKSRPKLATTAAEAISSLGYRVQ